MSLMKCPPPHSKLNRIISLELHNHPGEAVELVSDLPVIIPQVTLPCVTCTVWKQPLTLNWSPSCFMQMTFIPEEADIY